MAKRGYRGKHPNNDMKVAPESHKAANTAKLTAEYNKTGAKNKYDYIKSHDGFHPQGSGTVEFKATVAVDKIITIISTDGTSIDYTAAAAEDLAENEFKRDLGTNTLIANSLLDCINSAVGHGGLGKVTASETSAGIITITQVEPGPDGNTALTSNAVIGQVVPTSFTGG